MGDDQRKPGSDLFIVDNSDADWKVRNYLAEWCGLAKSIDIATGYFEIGALLRPDMGAQGMIQMNQPYYNGGLSHAVVSVA